MTTTINKLREQLNDATNRFVAAEDEMNRLRANPEAFVAARDRLNAAEREVGELRAKLYRATVPDAERERRLRSRAADETRLNFLGRRG